MRTVRRPITMFVAAVLAVICIGVGVVAATTSQPVYGPSWGRFSAAFPGCVSERQLSPAIVAFGYQPSSSYSGGCTGWTGYAPLSLPIEADSVTAFHGPVGNPYPSPIQVLAFKTVWFHKGVSEQQQSMDGLHVTSLGPQCASGSCRAVELVSNGRVAWTVTAISHRSKSAVESFLASFQPIG